MGTEELGRSDPVDWLGLLGGCDKTTPALIMGAISAGLPAIFVPAGPMLRGNLRGGFLGSGSDTWKYWDDLRAGVIGERDWMEVENGIARSFGTRSEEHTSELQSLMRISYAVFCLKQNTLQSAILIIITRLA